MAYSPGRINALLDTLSQRGGWQSIQSRDIYHSSNAFQGFRYFAEDLLQPGEGWLGGEVIPVVRERIIELRPEWKNLAPAILRSNSPTFPIRS